MNIKCATCGSSIRFFVNDIASPGEVWPFCEKCETYVDVVPGSSSETEAKSVGRRSV